jgi:homopolymeric O-antigen transport system permease protein
VPTETTDATRVDAGTQDPSPPPKEADRDDRVTVIRPPSRFPRLDVAELWAYRELFGILVWRDLKVRYKQTAIGAIWAVFQPVLIAAVYTIVFGRFAKFPSGDIYYPVFVFAGLLPWQYFASSISSGATSLVTNVSLVTKVYFPRVLLPVSAVAVPIVDLALGCVVLAVLMAIWGPMPAWPEVLFAPAFLGLAVLTAVGVVLLLSAVNVRYRDVPHAIPVFLQVLPLLSGVPFAIDQAPEKWQWILSLNPLTSVVSGWRWCILGSAEPEWGQVALSVAVALVLVVVGLAYFRRSEPRFADMI